MKTSLFKSALVVTIGLGLAARASAQTSPIDLDFITSAGSSSVNTNGYGPGAAAIGASGDVWNNVDINSAYFAPGNLPATVPLYDTGDILSGVHLTINTGVEGTYNLTDSPVQNELFTPGFDELSATISGLTPGATYELVLYGPDATSDLFVNGNAFPSWTSIGSGFTSFTVGHGFNEESVVVPGNGDLVLTDPSSAEQITAFQIAPAPEPSAWGLAAVGGLSLLAYRRRVGKLTAARQS